MTPPLPQSLLAVFHTRQFSRISFLFFPPPPSTRDHPSFPHQSLSSHLRCDRDVRLDVILPSRAFRDTETTNSELPRVTDHDLCPLKVFGSGSLGHFPYADLHEKLK